MSVPIESPYGLPIIPPNDILWFSYLVPFQSYRSVQILNTLSFWAPPIWGLRGTYTVHLRLIEKLSWLPVNVNLILSLDLTLLITSLRIMEALSSPSYRLFEGKWETKNGRFGFLSPFLAIWVFILGSLESVYSGLPIIVYWRFFFARCYGSGATSEYRLKIGVFAPTFKFQVEGVGRPHQPLFKSDN